MTDLDPDTLRKIDVLNLIAAVRDDDLTRADQILQLLQLYADPDDRYLLALSLASCAASMTKRLPRGAQELAEIRHNLLNDEGNAL
jgi:hypothetical protein